MGQKQFTEEKVAMELQQMKILLNQDRQNKLHLM